MNGMDWKDRLSSLLPEGYEPEQTPEEQIPERPRPKLSVAIDRHRAGKTATIITGFETDDERAGELCKDLRRLCACGGSTRDGEILIQGDRVDQIKAYLRQQGYKTNK